MSKKPLIIMMLTMFMLTGCGEKTSSSSTNSSSKEPTNVSSSSSSSTSKETLLEFENVTYSDLSVTYDGNSHILNEVTNAPEGTTIVYENRQNYTDAGSYVSKATLTKQGYNSKTLTATLTILKAEFAESTYQYKDVSVNYDGLDHIDDVQLVGVLPEGTTTSKKVKDKNGNEVSSAIDVGNYYYELVVTNKNYNSITLNATLTIKAVRKDMPVFASDNGTIYFANGLHNRYLYSYTSTSDNNISLVDYSSPNKFNKSSSSAIYISKYAILNAAKEIGNSSSDVLYTDSSMTDLVKYSSTVYYYSKVSLLNSQANGIYKVDSTNQDSEPVVSMVASIKADNLAIYNNNLYFINNSDEGYLYKLNLSTNTTSLVLNKKVREFVIDSNKIYCAINGALNDYLSVIDLAASTIEEEKLTDASGEFLTVRNGYLYYNYTDLYKYIDSSKKGIWRINLSSKVLEQVFHTEDVNGFDVDSSNNIYYVNTNDLHLYKYNILAKTIIDLLSTFVIPTLTPLNTGGKTITVGSRVFYQNMYANKCLFMYDEKSKQTTQLTPNKVADFYIYNDTLYLNEVTMLVNNDIYVANIKTGSEATKINSNDIRNLTTDGTYIYGTHYNWAGLSGGIARMKLDGSEYVKFSDVNGAKNFQIKDDKLYFINCTTGQDNGDIQYYTLSDISNDSTKLTATDLPSTNKIKNVRQFIFEGNDTIYYLYQGTVYNFLARSSLTSLAEGTKLANSKCSPKEMFIQGDYIYYYSYPVTSLENAGLFRVNKNNTTTDTNIESILKCNSTYYCSALGYTSSNNIYFLNYLYSGNLPYGDAHYYQINLNNSNQVTKIS